VPGVAQARAEEDLVAGLGGDGVRATDDFEAARGSSSATTNIEVPMFEKTKAFSGFAVDDIEAARRFYGETLGLKVTEANGLLTLHIAGDRPTIVYPRPGHEPAAYTILNFPVDDIDAAVDALTERGVTFERYEGMEQDDRGIMRAGGPYIAWFTDPAGNVLSVLQER
jgi:catechol 2,3-dioxygenase-like lactoylglutathione lyase family enzyme